MAQEASLPQRASLRFLLSHPAHFIALGAGSGLSPRAPGTIGSLYGWLLFRVLDGHLSDAQWAFGLIAAFLLGAHLKIQDPGAIVWDEIVAMCFVLWLVSPVGFWGELVAFLLFRFFDAAKPGPVGAADRHFGGGLGIMLDDLVAALCTLFVIAIFRHVV
jgi:phosphatidylglycerophosphatase A